MTMSYRNPSYKETVKRKHLREEKRRNEVKTDPGQFSGWFWTAPRHLVNKLLGPSVSPSLFIPPDEIWIDSDKQGY